MFDELQKAIREGNIYALQDFLVAVPALLDQRCDRGWTPLIVASYHGQSECIRKLLALGADVNLTNEKGTTPLMYAKGHYLRTGDSEPMHILLRAGADTNAADKNSLTLLEYVAPERRAEITAIFQSVSPNQAGRPSK